MDEIWDALIAHLEARGDYFRIFDRHRMRPDGWLKVETLHVLSQVVRRGAVRDVRPDRQGCDVWFATAGGECWLTTKGLITSYAGGAREMRATVLSMEEVSRELDKLRGLATLSGGNPAILFAAFPFGPEPRENDEWRSQLLRFEAKGFERARSHAFSLGGDREARVYIFA